MRALILACATTIGLVFAAPASACSPPPQLSTVWPKWTGEVVPPDAVLWVLQPYGGRGMPTELELRHDDELVEIEVYTIPAASGGSLLAVRGLTRFASGEYTLAAGPFALSHFSVGNNLMREATSPPEPSRRTLEAEVWYEQHDICGTGQLLTFIRSQVDYSLCSDIPVLAYALGDEEPPLPTVEDPGAVDFRALYGGQFRLEVDASWSHEGAGAEVTVWFGTFSPSGEFSGWTSDFVRLPEEPGSRRIDIRQGGGVCPDGSWLEGDVQTGLGEPQVEETDDTGAPAGKADTADTADTGTDGSSTDGGADAPQQGGQQTSGCACDAASGGSLPLLGLLLLPFVRIRRASE